MMTAALAFVLVSWQWRRAEAKAVAEALAHAEARRAHREAVRGRAELAMDHGRALCEQGEIGQGMLWLARSLRLAAEARDDALERAARINLAEWSARLAAPWRSSVLRRRPATWPSGRTAGRSSPWARTGRCIPGTPAPGARPGRHAPPPIPATRGPTSRGLSRSTPRGAERW